MSSAEAQAVPNPPRTWSWEGLPTCLVLACLVFAVYRVALPAPFLFDDENQITLNTDVRRLWPLAPFFDEARPVVFYTFALNYAVAKYQPFTYRLTNVAIHIAAACVLYDLVRRTLRLPSIPVRYHARAGGIAFAVALLWAIHPLQTGAVSYIIQRCESLMGLCYLFALYSVLRGATSTRSGGWYGAGAVAALFGAGVKEVIVTLPLVALLYDRAFLAASWNEIVRRRWFVYVAFTAAAGLSIFLLWNLLRHRDSTSAGFGAAGITPWEYLRSQPAVLLHYLRLVVWPDRLVLDYGWPKAESPAEIYGLGAVVVLLLLTSAILWWKQPALGFLGLTWFFILAPTSSFVPIADIYFEHRMYLPLACVVILLVLAVHHLLERRIAEVGLRNSLAAVLLVAAFYPLAARTYYRNREYRSAEQMWRSVVEANPHHGRAWNNLAAIVSTKPSRSDEGLELYRRAVEENPNEAMFQDNLGNVYARKHEYAAAAEWYRRAIATKADYLDARLHLSQASLLQGRDRDALEAVRAAEEQFPDSYKVQRERAFVLAWAQDPEVADPAEAVKLTADLLERYKNRNAASDFLLLRVRVDALAAAGQWDDALAETNQALATAKKLRANPLIRTMLELRREAFTKHEPWTAEREIAGIKAAQAEKIAAEAAEKPLEPLSPPAL